MAGIVFIIFFVIGVLLGYIAYDKISSPSNAIKGNMKYKHVLSIFRFEEFSSLKKNVKALSNKFNKHQVIVQNIKDAEEKLRLLAKSIQATDTYTDILKTPNRNKIRSSLTLFKYVNQLNETVVQLPDFLNNLTIDMFEEISQKVLDLTFEINSIDKNVFVIQSIDELNKLNKKDDSQNKTKGNGAASNPYVLSEIENDNSIKFEKESNPFPLLEFWDFQELDTITSATILLCSEIGISSLGIVLNKANKKLRKIALRIQSTTIFQELNSLKEVHSDNLFYDELHVLTLVWQLLELISEAKASIENKLNDGKISKELKDKLVELTDRIFRINEEEFIANELAKLETLKLNTFNGLDFDIKRQNQVGTTVNW